MAKPRPYKVSTNLDEDQYAAFERQCRLRGFSQAQMTLMLVHEGLYRYDEAFKAYVDGANPNKPGKKDGPKLI